MDGWWSETAIIEGAPPSLAEPHGWGISVSRSGEFHLSVITGRGEPGPSAWEKGSDRAHNVLERIFG